MKKTAIFALALMMLLVGCKRGTDVSPDAATEDVQVNNADTETEGDKEQKPEQEPEAEKSVVNKAAWCVYWDSDPVNDTGSYSQYKEIVLFGCIYSEDHSLFIPEKLDKLAAEYHDKNPAGSHELYISFINDIMHPDGTSTQKSTDFLQTVLPDAELSDKVIDDMINQARIYGLDGIELDYENIHKCDDLWGAYLDFISRLYKRAASSNLKLRVILSVSTPVDKLEFIDGPQYVVMCYNLYGSHTGPGPKADEEFLRDTYNKFKDIKADYALANGGFEWGPDNKTIRSLTAADAEVLAKDKGAEISRNSNGTLNYSYEAGDGVHTVVYGDEQTIEKWNSVLLENADNDVGINLWRLE